MPTLRSKFMVRAGVPHPQPRQRTRSATGGAPCEKTRDRADPGVFTSRESAVAKRHSCNGKLEATSRFAWSREEKPNARILTLDGCLTDPEPGMDSRRATVRNVRSKCRCSCVLQFTFRRAVSCVLHRPPSQVIHCIVLFLSKFCSELQVIKINSTRVFHIPSRGRAHKPRTRANAPWPVRISS